MWVGWVIKVKMKPRVRWLQAHLPKLVLAKNYYFLALFLPKLAPPQKKNLAMFQLGVNSMNFGEKKTYHYGWSRKKKHSTKDGAEKKTFLIFSLITIIIKNIYIKRHNLWNRFWDNDQ